MPPEMTNHCETRTANAAPALTQLQPFNEFRFNDCMAFLAEKHSRALSLYEMMKLHVMIDVYHTIAHGKPVIGGPIAAFTNGPVPRSSKSHIARWKKIYEQSGQMPDGFLIEEHRDRLTFIPTQPPSRDDFSDAEIAAMDRAWTDVVYILDKDGDEEGWIASQKYFHKDSFIGRAWEHARHHGTSLDWCRILDEYKKDHQDADIDGVKSLLCI